MYGFNSESLGWQPPAAAADPTGSLLGFTMPFIRATGSLGLFVATRDDITATKQNIRALLLTNHSERVMQNNMGCNLRWFLFEQMIPGQTEVVIEERIASQVARWLPYVVMDDIKVTLPKERPNTILVEMTFHLISKPDHVEQLSEEVAA